MALGSSSRTSFAPRGAPPAGGGGTPMDVEDEGMVVIAAATILNFTNAELVTVGGPGQADIRVGFAANKAVTLGTERTIAGAGDSTLVQSGSGVGAGVSGGGIAVAAGTGQVAGGTVTIDGGAGVVAAAADGGNVLVRAGNALAGGTGFGGAGLLQGGDGNFGGGVVLQGGQGIVAAGVVTITAGSCPAAPGGHVRLEPGAGSVHGDVVLIDDGVTAYTLRPTSALLLNLGRADLAFNDLFVWNVFGPDGNSLLVQAGAPAPAGDTGKDVSVFATDGTGAGPVKGGDIFVRPGLQVGAAAHGNVYFEDQGTSYSLLPVTDNLLEIGSDTFRWRRVRATTVVTGDLELRDDERRAWWTLRETPDGIEAVNRHTGARFRLAMVPA